MKQIVYLNNLQINALRKACLEHMNTIQKEIELFETLLKQMEKTDEI
jgi:hypothetical protein